MDIDIDLPSTFEPSDIFKHCIKASRVADGELVKHPAGVYLQNIPTDPVTGLSAIPFKEAEEVGYFKIDLLHLQLLDVFNSKQELRALSKLEPDWDLLLVADNVSKLFQIRKRFDLISKVKPTSVMELSDCIALIRPAKIKLQEQYINTNDRPAMRDLIYSKPDNNGMWFKKGHAVAYATTIVLQLHLLKGGLL